MSLILNHLYIDTQIRGLYKKFILYLLNIYSGFIILPFNIDRVCNISTKVYNTKKVNRVSRKLCNIASVNKDFVKS